MPDIPGLLENRLVELEIKTSFAEDMLDQLNQEIFRQQQQIDRLTRELAALSAQIKLSGETPTGNLRDDLPPHY